MVSFSRPESSYLVKAQRTLKKQHPINTVPTEIVLLIFEEYCRTAAPLESSTSSECLLTHVCQSWRSVILNLPTLWTKFSVSPKTPPSILSMYLQRSKKLSLDLEIDLKHNTGDSAIHERVIKLWEVLKPTVYRWRRLNIHIGPHDIPFVSKDLRQADTPLLEDLRVTCDAHTPGTTELFDGRPTPSLKSLRLSDVSILQFTPSLGQITRLHLTSTSPMQVSAFREVASKMVKLEELTLQNRVVEGWPVYPAQEDIITFPSLTVLNISDHRWPLFVPLLSISAPVLTSLSLYDLVGHDLPDASTEKQITTQYPSVRNLALKGKSSFIDEASFTQLSRIFPAVDNFALLGVESAFIDESCYILHEPSLWPKMRTLSTTPMVAENILCSLLSMRSTSAEQAGLKKLVGPMPTQFRRMEWISQRVKVEECHDSLSVDGHLN